MSKEIIAWLLLGGGSLCALLFVATAISLLVATHKSDVDEDLVATHIFIGAVVLIIVAISWASAYHMLQL